MAAKLIVIESGTDSSGKETQTKKLYQKLKQEKKDILKVEYPNYKSESSALIKMYLKGEFGAKAESVNAYAASSFFAVDRYASFKQNWSLFYQQGGIIIADRYTTSNMIHQGSKIEDNTKRKKYLDWLEDYEFNKLGLPKPDIVIFLNLKPELSAKLMKKRQEKEESTDIHEVDKQYLVNCYKTALKIAKNKNWEIIDCAQQGKLRTIDDIAQEVYQVVKNNL